MSRTETKVPLKVEAAKTFTSSVRPQEKSEVDIVLDSADAWYKQLEGVICTNRGPQQHGAFETMCCNMKKEVIDVLNNLTNHSLLVSVTRLRTELERDQDYWLNKVVIKGNKTEIHYYITTIKNRTFASALGFILGVASTMKSPELDEKVVPWITEPIGGIGPTWKITPEYRALRESHMKLKALDAARRS
jgi:hypothetical protein